MLPRGCGTPFQPAGPDGASPFFSAELVPALGDPYNHAATLVELDDGALLAAWAAGSGEAAADSRIAAARLSPGATAWDAPRVLADAPGLGDANPVLFASDGGYVRLLRAVTIGQTLCTSTLLSSESSDGGATFGDERVALPAVCTLLKNRPARLGPNHWLLPAYVQGVFAAWFFESIDDGANWLPAGAPILTLPNNLQPAVARRADGTLFALLRSADGAGFTWQAEACHPAAWRLSPRTDLPNPGSGLDLIRLSSGHFMAAYNDSPTERTPLVVALSADEGRSWSSPKTIESGPGPYSYPTLLEARDGTIHCVYSYLQQQIKHAAFNRAWVESG
ncbi:MAG: exo-alpha-sialidase [Phycisphaerae bacterium]